MTPTATPTQTPTPIPSFYIHYTFDEDEEGWKFYGWVPPYDMPVSAYMQSSLRLTPLSSTNSFSYWYSPDITVTDNQLYSAHWNIGSTCANPDQTVQFRLRVNQIGSWQAWERIVNSNLQQAPCAGTPLWYAMYLDPNVTGIADNDLVLSFDIMSFSLDDDTSSWIFVDEVIIEQSSIDTIDTIQSYTFDTGPEGWVFKGMIPPYDTPLNSSTGGRLGLSPNGSTNCFSYWQSPQIELRDNAIQRIRMLMSSSVTNPDQAVQFRLRINQLGSWQAWDRGVNSNYNQAPSSSSWRWYDIYFFPDVTGSTDNSGVISLDMMSFDWSDDVFSWLYLEQVLFEELSLSP